MSDEGRSGTVGSLLTSALSNAPLKNECVKAPGMTAPDGRGSIVKSIVFQSRDLRERSAALVGL